MADYRFDLHTPFGVKLASIDDFVSFDSVRVVNGIGALTLIVPKKYDQFLFTGNDVIVDNRIAPQRRIGGGGFYLEGETHWLIVDGEKILTDDGQRYSKLYCVDANDILDRHIVAYATGSAQAEKAATFADNSMKDVVRQNMGSTATDTTRDLSAYLSVQANLSLGASIAKAFSRKNVLDVLKDYADSSHQAGTYLAFDIVAPTSTTLEFRVYSGQRGVDRRYPSGSSPIFIGPEFGNLSSVVRGYYHSKEVNYAYAGGQGTGSARAIGTSSDSARIALSPFNRREKFIDSRLTADPVYLADEADSAVKSGLPRRTFTGQFIDTPSCTYGLHVGFGDFVTAVFEQESIDCRLNRVHLSMSGGNEKIDIQLKAD
jgi:hypothetical protein